MQEIVLRFPRKVGKLSPNSRSFSWKPKAGATKRARKRAEEEAFIATIGMKTPVFERCQLVITFIGCNAPDQDNMIACMKGYIDGLQPRIVANDKLTKIAEAKHRKAEFWEKPHIELRITAL